MAEGHREAAPRVLDGREHDGSLAAEGRRHITRHIAVYPRNLTAANTQVICTFKQGRIADRGPDAQQFRASGLNLVIAAIVHWNSTYLADAVDHLRSERHAVPAELLTHTSPLTWEHIGFSGDFLWDRAAATAGQRRPLNLSRERMAA
jgi:hypothetical protein